jgi:hypothetical protein
MKTYLLIRQHKKLAVLIIFALDILYFIFLNPNNLAFYLMFVGFVLVLANTYIICRSAYKLMNLMGFLRSYRRWRIESITLFVFVLLIMQALGQLTFIDIAALIPITLLGYWYFTYVGSQKITS